MSGLPVCDLHTHSVYSDGTVTPAQLIASAEEIGLTAVALCDHNTVAGLPEFLDAGKDSPVEAVPGIEFSTDYRDVELHVLALFVKPEHFGLITEQMDEALARKERSNVELAEKLNRAGYAIDYAAIKAATPDGLVNRALIAAALTEQGYTTSVQDAFKKLLAPGKGFYDPPRRPDTFEIIRFIKSMGAVCVLAHPFLNLNGEELRDFLEQAVPCGLDGMEVRYPKYDEDTTRLAEKMAEEFGLLPSGGSDFHGANKPDIALGTGRGTLAVPSEWLEDLRFRAAL